MSYKVLIVDDSALMRKHHQSILKKAGFTTETAINGQDCLNLLASFNPDVITLDINMPIMDGLSCLKKIMQIQPTPVVMVSSLTEKNAQYTLDALALGAIDYIQKPYGQYTMDMGPAKALMIEKVKAAAQQKGRIKPQIAPLTPSPVRAIKHTNVQYDLVVVGVSTGGPNCLQTIMPHLPADYPTPIVIAQHMPARFTRVFAERLNSICKMPVIEVTTKTQLNKSYIYLAQGEADISIEKIGGTLYASPCELDKTYMWHPSVSKLVDSALKVVNAKRLCCVQLTGMGNDGAKEMANAYQQGATTIAESEETSVVYGMPKELVKHKGATFVVPNHQIAELLF